MSENVDWDRLFKTLCDESFQIRIKPCWSENVPEWEQCLLQPTVGYVELPCLGPVRISDIEWVELDPVITIKTGRLTKERRENRRDALLACLDYLGVKYTERGGVFRVASPGNGFGPGGPP